MGCINSNIRSNNNNNQNVEKTYSWSTRDKVDSKEYTVEKLNGQVAIKLPETLNGTPFVIQNCQDSRVYVFDFLSTASIDNCVNCTIFLGPVKGSVNLRNCINCNVMVSCQQFRARDCNQLNIFIHCITQPTIENCTQLGFACYAFNYTQLIDQFRCSSLSMFNNLWNQIYDFNASDDEQNWCLLPYNVEPEMYFTELARVSKNMPPPKPALIDGELSASDRSIGPSNLSMADRFKVKFRSKDKNESIQLPKSCIDPKCVPIDVYEMNITFDPAKSAVPKTTGINLNKNSECCIIVFFADGNRERKSRATFAEMHKYQDILLIHTKEFIMKTVEAESIFETQSYNTFVQRGPLIVLYFSGANCLKLCTETAMRIELDSGSAGLVYVSPNTTLAKRQVELIFNEKL